MARQDDDACLVTHGVIPNPDHNRQQQNAIPPFVEPCFSNRLLFVEPFFEENRSIESIVGGTSDLQTIVIDIDLFSVSFTNAM